MEIYLAIAVMAGVNFFTRIFPFIFFIKHEPPKVIVFIQKFFPAIIMTILILYSLKDVSWSQNFALKEILSVGITAFLHIKFNNYLISIFSGTIIYMGLVQFF